MYNGIGDNMEGNNDQMENQNNERRKKLYLLGPLMLLVALGGVSFAIFNYTRTGTANVIRVGKISFNANQTENINLVNVFPIDRSDAGTDLTNVDEALITITGDTTYDDGIEYLVTATDFSNTVGSGANAKTVPISISVTASSGLGTVDADYFTNRGGNSSIYKVLSGTELVSDEQVLVGYITKGQAGVSGSLTIKAFLDKDKIGISDTYDGTESDSMGTTNEWADGRTILTTTEWNSLQTNGISFKIKVEANEGIWVEEQITSYEQITRNVITPTNPINFANASSSSNGEGLYILPGTENNTNPIYYYRGAVNNNNVIFGDYCWQMVRTTDTGGIKMIYNGAVTGNGETCENTAHADRVLTSNSAFNSQYQSVPDVGYMKNERYTYTNAEGETGSIYGKKVEWDGTNYLVIEDTANVASSNTTKDNNHHYSCGTSGTSSCPSVRYYYYDNYYITLANGELVEDAIYKMTGNIVNQNIDVVARNSGYVLNNTDSTIKTAIESWFRTNLTNEVDNTKRNYVNYIEDTVYCNDRSLKTTGSSSKYEQSGWNPNGGDLTKELYFGTWNRYRNDWYSTTNVPSTACPNETDRFSVGSSVAHLNYPVGLLTADEIVMAGASGSLTISNTSYYLYTGNHYWSLSPYLFGNNDSREFVVYNDGKLSTVSVNSSKGVRPVVSLKPGTEFESGGEGTTLKPYVVKYE